MDTKSYERIAERIGCQPEEITFLTDVSRGKLECASLLFLVGLEMHEAPVTFASFLF